MATTSARDKNPRATRQPLTMILWQEALLEWGIPVILIAAIACLALLGAFEEIAHTTGVLALGWLLLLLVGFLLFKPILTGAAVETRHKSLTWGLAFVWIT